MNRVFFENNIVVYGSAMRTRHIPERGAWPVGGIKFQFSFRVKGAFQTSGKTRLQGKAASPRRPDRNFPEIRFETGDIKFIDFQFSADGDGQDISGAARGVKRSGNCKIGPGTGSGEFPAHRKVEGRSQELFPDRQTKIFN